MIGLSERPLTSIIEIRTPFPAGRSDGWLAERGVFWFKTNSAM